MGSRYGLLTKPSKPFIMLTVAALTAEGGQFFGGFVFGPGAVFGRQHLKLEGPGQRPETVFPDSQLFTFIQLPPFPQTGLTQHLISAGSLGQKPVCDVPPLEEHDAVDTHTPGVPFATEQGPLRAAWTTMALSAKVTKESPVR
jgi:hypothetical protein